MDIPNLTIRVLGKFFDRVIVPIYIKFGSNGEITFGFERHVPLAGTIDDRLLKIEVARKNLEEALVAIKELEFTAEQNKIEFTSALQQLEATRREHADAERQLEAVKHIAQSDIDTFRELAGVPSKVQVAKERFIGFMLGVFASVTASGVLWALSKIWPLLKS